MILYLIQFEGGEYLIEITIVDKNDILIASIQVGSKTDIPFVIGEIIEKNGYKVLIDEEPEE